MGHRANLLVMSDLGTELYYSHWRASTLDRDLFWGPAHALRFIRDQRSEDEGAEWLDEVWAEGGALLDLGERRLLWWGGQDLCWDVPDRRLHIELMATVWQDWDILWCHEGIVDLARYAGVPIERVVTEPGDRLEPDLSPPESSDFVDFALSVKRGGEVVQFPLAGEVDDQLWSCDRLAELAGSAPGVRELDLEGMEGFPTSGGCVDVERREVDFWTANDCPLIESRLAEVNPGWTIRWHRDRYESQLEAAPGLKFPRVDRDTMLAALERWLLGPEVDHSNYLSEMIGVLHPEGEVAINPLGNRDDPPMLDEAERARIWQLALAAWRATSDR